jgi:hypothetical protein
MICPPKSPDSARSRRGFEIFLTTTLLVPLVAVHAEPVKQGEAVVRLLNLFASQTDGLAVANAGKLLNQGASPSIALAADPHAPLPSLGGWNSPDTTRSLARQLGEYVAEHSVEFAGGLPNPSSIQEPLRLEAFFEGLYQPTLGVSGSASYFQRDLARLSSLLDDSWLDAAAACGASNIQQLLLTHRGDLRTLLRSYQESKDETSLLVLGETLASYSEAYRQIEPREFHPRTLALLLAGSLGAPNFEPDENLNIIITAAQWTLAHPELIDLLRYLRDPASLSLLEAALLWSKDREKSMKQLASIHWVSPRARARLAMELFQDSALSESEAAHLIRLLPSETLNGWLNLTKSEKFSDRQTKLKEWIATELSSRSDNGKAAR